MNDIYTDEPNPCPCESCNPDTDERVYCDGDTDCRELELITHRYPTEHGFRLEHYCEKHSDMELAIAVKEYGYTARMVGDVIVFTKNEEVK